MFCLQPLVSLELSFECWGRGVMPMHQWLSLQTKWVHWLQVDTGRAETPLTAADQEDTYPRGMALDLTCMEDVCIGTGGKVWVGEGTHKD